MKPVSSGEIVAHYGDYSAVRCGSRQMCQCQFDFRENFEGIGSLIAVERNLLQRPLL
jgi:hypothetical protein